MLICGSSLLCSCFEMCSWYSLFCVASICTSRWITIEILYGSLKGKDSTHKAINYSSKHDCRQIYQSLTSCFWETNIRYCFCFCVTGPASVRNVTCVLWNLIRSKPQILLIGNKTWLEWFPPTSDSMYLELPQTPNNDICHNKFVMETKHNKVKSHAAPGNK